MGSGAYEEYAQALANASLLAQQELSDALSRIDLDRPRTARDAVISVVTAIVTKYAGVAALAAAEYYGAERAAAGWPDDYEVGLADPVPVEQIEASVRYAAGHLFGGDDDGAEQGRVRGLFDGEG
jgi:hypothetical protein